MSIKVLLPHVINQIAAGEVMNRPASVVKELVENSLDANANRIEIDIECGGAQCIRIRDNGHGIAKDELLLAISNHATSKIVSLEDLEKITSMGFRGEALANISAISRLILTSRTIFQNEAWQIYKEGGGREVIKPDTHPVGTTVEVLDLFYNTPARRKCMRTQQTEFIYIDKIIRSIAISRFDVTFIMQHNGKIVRNYIAVSEKNKLLRLRKLCGSNFVSNAIEVLYNNCNNLSIKGWIVVDNTEKLLEIQYSYVNKRTVSNKLFNNAIRQAYQEKLKTNKIPSFILFLNIDPNQIDINVHPAKFEVRFHQARLVYNFIYTSIIMALNKIKDKTINKNIVSVIEDLNNIEKKDNHSNNTYYKYKENELTSNGSNVFKVSYNDIIKKNNSTDIDTILHNHAKFVYEKLYDHILLSNINYPKISSNLIIKLEEYVHTEPLIKSNSHIIGKVLYLLEVSYALVEFSGSLALLSLSCAERYLIEHKLMLERYKIKDTLFPVTVYLTLSDKESETLKKYQEILKKMGIVLQFHVNEVKLNAVPLLLHKQDLKKLITELLDYLYDENTKILVKKNKIAAWIAYSIQKKSVIWNYSKAIELINELNNFYPKVIKYLPKGLLVKLNFECAIKALSNE